MASRSIYKFSPDERTLNVMPLKIPSGKATPVNGLSSQIPQLRVRTRNMAEGAPRWFSQVSV